MKIEVYTAGQGSVQISDDGDTAVDSYDGPLSLSPDGADLTFTGPLTEIKYTFNLERDSKRRIGERRRRIQTGDSLPGASRCPTPPFEGKLRPFRPFVSLLSPMRRGR
jgi:hypothetical protein